ncbi:pseudouridine synthase [Azorhizobium oxalatiphilum]|uniref:Pseudouridine synthase n=1 Tax=Azorhizobium oxalatiphilum TaxID=980631 RepID=A0A917BY83_9HYPH|nr:pseudouridine synthase [Azorhizobium oxalatiphilum]GGF60796.1 pseudouridine synthase [Azorhizobium oxalatiphilum]
MPRTSPPRKDKNNVPRAKRALPRPAPKEAERIAKVIARAGLGSRREIEDWIAEGRVSVNGKVLESPAFTVTATDEIKVDGQPLPERERTRLFLYHKPNGVVTTNRDPEGRTTLFELLPPTLPRLVSVGRLDLNSEGLLLLTNDGGLARVLELPETGWLRRYRVRAKGTVDQSQLDGLIKGITVEGVEYGSIEAVLDRVQGANVWITVALREGKNREVRNVLGALGLQVNRLIRVSYGPFQLGDVPEGGVEEVRTRILRDQLGDDITAAAQADFNGPLIEREEEDVRPARATATEKRAARAAEAAAEKPARGARRAVREEIDPERPPRVPLRKREGEQDRKIVRVGTVADRKGREIKVERKLAPLAEDKPARRPRGERSEEGRGRAPAREGSEGRGSGRFARGEGRSSEGRSREDRPERPFRERDGAAKSPRFSRGGDERPSRPPRGDAPRRGTRSEPREEAVPPFRDRIERSSWRADEAPARERSERPRRDRPEREGSERPFRQRDDSRPGREFKPRTGAPRGRGAPGEDGPDRSGRSPWRSDEDRPARARPQRERTEGDRPARAGRSDRPQRERPEGDRPQRAGRSDRPQREGSERPFRQREERAPGTFKPRFARDRDAGGDDVGFSGAGRGGKPGFKAEGRGGPRGGKPGGFKSGGPRGDGPSRGGPGGGPARGKGGPKAGGPKGRPTGGKPGPRSRG